ncbi:MAG: ABC-F family ATP-binding cassette domain-containing protein [Rhodothermales bacterium]
MIQLQNIDLAFGGRPIFDRLTWTIKPGQSIGLIGPNGAGKSTLLRAIAGSQPIDGGEVTMGGTTTVGFLEQDIQEAPTDRTIKEEAMLAFAEILKLQAEEERLVHQMEAQTDHESPAYHKLLHAFDDVHARLAGFEAHRISDRTESVLAGLGFEADDMDRPLQTFSGGWRMRVALAKLLLRQPDFLLLDEPTNHLDIDSIAWLEEYLKAYPGTVVIVSHDRYFLDRMVRTTAELIRGKIVEYAGNYSFYLKDRVLQRDIQRAAYENQQKQIAEAERFITRFKAKATKAKQAQSRVKMLDKLERIPPPPDEEAGIHFRFPEPKPAGRVVLELSEYSKRYDTPEGRIDVFKKARPMIIERGDKIALTGKNGAGKSTLARILNGTEPFEGTRKLGFQVEMTYFAQHQADTLNPNHTILDSMYEVGRGHTETELRSVLGAFLFSGDDVFKYTKVLSGGEKSRVALARTLLRPANFLILDEPTNHLDIRSINVLIEALKQYTGTFVVVSHDRHFLDQIVNKVWRVEHGEAREYLGNYADYLWQMEHGTAGQVARRQDSAAAPQNGATAEDKAAKRSGGPKTKEQKRLEAEERQRRRDAERQGGAAAGNGSADLSPKQLRAAYRDVEVRIEKKEAEKKKLEAVLADPTLYEDPEKSRATTVAYQTIKDELASLYATWEQMAEQLAEVES